MAGPQSLKLLIKVRIFLPVSALALRPLYCIRDWQDKMFFKNSSNKKSVLVVR